jgi:hypothetical protein
MRKLHIPEDFLRVIWQRQQFDSSRLHTSDGQPVRILSPGIANTDGGPDFRNAKIRIGDTTFLGDVELHREAASWEEHHHHSDPHYNRVVLHVVLSVDPLSAPAQTASKRAIPVLVLHPFLDDHLRGEFVRSLLAEDGGRTHTLACYGLNESVPEQLVTRWLQHLAIERIELKIRRYEERMKQLIDEQRSTIREPYPRYYGNPDEIPPPTTDYTRKDFTSRALWEQTLYEGMMEALGFSKNREPFRTLAQSMRLEVLRRHNLSDTHTMMALLFGAGGLLPRTRTLPEKGARAYVRALRRTWRTLRPSFKGKILHEGDWLFFRLRPANFPTARLASMCFLLPSLFGEESFRSLIRLMKNDPLSTRQRMDLLHRMFAFEADEFWGHQYHFAGVPSKHGIALGAARINDILLNAVVPILLLYARIFKDGKVRQRSRTILNALPPSQPNTVTRTMERQLLKEKQHLANSVLQQGAIQLFKFYCSPARCAECDIGRAVGLGKPGAR